MGKNNSLRHNLTEKWLKINTKAMTRNNANRFTCAEISSGDVTEVNKTLRHCPLSSSSVQQFSGWLVQVLSCICESMRLSRSRSRDRWVIYNPCHQLCCPCFITAKCKRCNFVKNMYFRYVYVKWNLSLVYYFSDEIIKLF